MSRNARVALASIAIVALLGFTVSGSSLFARMDWGGATSVPPLDSPVTWSRAIQPSETAGIGTAEVLSLYLEDLTGSPNRYPWTLYTETRTNSGAASVGVTSRMRNEGNGWATGLHSEPIASGGGTTIGANVEATQLGWGRVVGVNIQAKSSYLDAQATGGVNEAINIQSDPGVGYVDGIRFDGAACGTGLHFSQNSTSTRAIWIEGTHAVGIQTSAPIRMGAGVPIQLEGTAQIAIVFANGRIEFRNGSRVLGYIAIDGSATGGRLN